MARADAPGAEPATFRLTSLGPIQALYSTFPWELSNSSLIFLGTIPGSSRSLTSTSTNLRGLPVDYEYVNGTERSHPPHRSIISPPFTVYIPHCPQRPYRLFENRLSNPSSMLHHPEVSALLRHFPTAHCRLLCTPLRGLRGILRATPNRYLPPRWWLDV
jgi:hypothetical protein